MCTPLSNDSYGNDELEESIASAPAEERKTGTVKARAASDVAEEIPDGGSSIYDEDDFD